MSAIYHLTIKPTNKENRFCITWHNAEVNTVHSFYREVEITLEESQRLWQWPQCQMSIGEKLFRFLDGDNRHFQQALDRANQLGELLQIHLQTTKQTADWPFELLAQDGIFLLPQHLHLVRTVSDWGKDKIIYPENRPLKLLFMACSAMNVKPELDFEKEEEAIFHITENLPIDMEVEDSGSLEGLRARLEKEHYDVVHLSGHANIDKNCRPYFIMEDETGYQHDVYPDKLWNDALIENSPRLLFLSGCRTGEVPDSSDTSDTPENTAEGSFARLLVENNKVPAVLGWGRSVSDKEASHAGKMIFYELSRGRSILEAVQRARFELIKNFIDIEKPAWPLLRLYSSDMPLNAIVKKGQRIQPKPRRMKHFLLKNSEVKVLAEGFVGRRRQLQTGLRTLKQDVDKVGVMLLGTGGLGKSCLAGKICERFPGHTLIIVHGRFNAITLESALTDAFIASQDEKGQQILSKKIEMIDKLSHLCSTSFKDKNYLLLLDDFEQNLDGADKGEPGQLLPEAADLLKVLLHYLPFSGKMTQLIITSRYEFSLIKGDKDLVEQRLDKVWLTSFQESEQQKKSRQLKNILNYENQSLVPQFLSAGHGNPRLMEWLDILVGQMAAVEVPRLLDAIKDKQEDFIREHVIRELLQKGGEELACFLRWFSIYRRPVLLDGVKQIAEKTGLSNWKEILQEGMRFSLVEHDQAHRSYQVTPLLREEFFQGLGEQKACHEAAFAYYKNSCDGKPDDQFDPILVEDWIYHALGSGKEDVASREGGKLVNHLREDLAILESQRVGLWILKQKKQELSTEHDAFLLHTLAYTINSLGYPQKAMDYYKEALTIRETVYGREHPKVTIVLNNLGATLQELGDPRKAIDYFEQAMTISEAIFGRGHPDVALSLNNLGGAWGALGDLKKAIEYFQEAKSIHEKLFGREHPKVAAGLNNLASTWNELGDPRKAIDNYQEALMINEAVFGREHPKAAFGLNNLGAAWSDIGDHLKAIDYYQEAMTIWMNVYGEKHPKVAAVLNNLGDSWRVLGKSKKAIDYFEQALRINEAMFGQEHPNVAIQLNNLGATWIALGEYRKAIDYFEKAMSIDEALFGRKHPNVALSLSNLGSAWLELGNPRKAINYFEQSLRINEATFGRKNSRVATDLNNIGVAWKDIGDHRKAIGYYQEALTIDEAVFGREHPDLAIQLNNLGEVLIVLREPKKAIDYIQRALAIWKNVYGEDHPKMAIGLNNLGTAWKISGNHRKAIGYFGQALHIDEAVFGREHPAVATDLNNLGVAWTDFGDSRKAIDFYQQALDIDKEVYGWGHPNVARELNNLGGAWRVLGEPRKAIEYYQQALSINEAAFGQKHPDVANVLNNLGAAWNDLGDHRKAIKYFENAFDIWKAVYGETHSQVATALNNLGLAWIALGDHRKAIEYFEKVLSIKQTLLGSDHPDVARELNYMGAAYFHLGQKEIAKEHLEQAYSIFNKSFGPDHPKTQVVRHWLNELAKRNLGSLISGWFERFIRFISLKNKG